MRLIRRNSSTVRVLLVAGVMILRASSPVVSILTMRDLRWLCRTGALPEIAALAPNTATGGGSPPGPDAARSEEHTSELQSLLRIPYAVFCLKNNKRCTTSHRSKHDQH